MDGKAHEKGDVALQAFLAVVEASKSSLAERMRILQLLLDASKRSGRRLAIFAVCDGECASGVAVRRYSKVR